MLWRGGCKPERKEWGSKPERARSLPLARKRLSCFSYLAHSGPGHCIKGFLCRHFAEALWHVNTNRCSHSGGRKLGLGKTPFSLLPGACSVTCLPPLPSSEVWKPAASSLLLGHTASGARLCLQGTAQPVPGWLCPTSANASSVALLQEGSLPSPLGRSRAGEGRKASPVLCSQ